MTKYGEIISTRYGKIIEITNEYAADDDDIVYTETDDNSVVGLHISRCQGFVPEVGDKVKIIISYTDDVIEKIEEN